MSLYRLCPWWSAQCPELGEHYDSVSLHCFALADEPNAGELLCVGSHSGYLSLYQPHPPDAKANHTDGGSALVDDDGEFTVDSGASGKPVDLVLEVKLAQPVLSVSSAVIISTVDKQRQLIVLHPHSVAIYAVRSSAGAGVDMSDLFNQTTLELCIEHRLQHAAFSLCHGPFGRQSADANGAATAQSPEFLCVTHLNGALTFFEQNGIAYECRLPAGGSSASGPGSLSLPGQLGYVSRIDAFVRVSAAGELECYRYQDASECAERQRPLEPVWRCCVGEWALDMRVVRTSLNESAIVLLGECNLLCITDNGTVRFIKRLDYTPICFESFLNGQHTDPHARLMTAVVTDRGGFVLIYAEATLVWCLQLSGHVTAQPPVAIRRANLRTLRGAFVTLGAGGLLSAGFLGTRPHPYQAPAMAVTGTVEHQLDVPRARQALAELETEIDRTLQLTGDQAVQSQLIGRELSVQLVVAPAATAAVNAQRPQCSVSVLLQSNVEHRVDQVQVHFDVGPPLQCSRPLHTFRQLGGASGSPSVRAHTAVHLMDAAHTLPGSLYVTAVVSFVNAHSVFRVVERRARLPVGVFARLAAPVKEAAALKVTLTVSGGDSGGVAGEMPTVSALLGAHFAGRLEANTQAIGVEPMGPAATIRDTTTSPTTIVTIVSAKNSNRYRLQCPAMTPLLPILLDTLITGLRELPEPGSKSAPVGRVIRLHAQLPIGGLEAAVAEHRTNCERLAELQRQLECSVAQMRLIVRRLFVKLDDRAGGGGNTGLADLQMLFGCTQTQLEQSVRSVERAGVEAQRTRNALSAWLQLLQLAVRHAAVVSGVPAQRRDGLLAIVWATPLRDWLAADWAELVQPSVGLMRHGGVLSVRDAEAFGGGGRMDGAAGAFDLAKLQRNLRDLFGPLFDGKDVAGPAEATDGADEAAGSQALGPSDENEWSDNAASSEAWQL